MWYITRCCDCQEFHPFIEAPGHGYCFIHQCEILHDDWCSRGYRSEETPDDELFFGVRDNKGILQYFESTEELNEMLAADEDEQREFDF